MSCHSSIWCFNSFSPFTPKICCCLQLLFISILPVQTVSLWGSSGRMEMTASKFMDIQRAIQPDWFQCISDGDTIAGEAGRKRAKKSVDRSLSFLDTCLQLQEKSPVRSPRYWGSITACASWSVLHPGPNPGCGLVGNSVTLCIRECPAYSPERGITSSTVSFPYFLPLVNRLLHQDLSHLY